MIDYGNLETEALLADTEREVRAVYSRASKEMEQKFIKFWEGFEARDEKKKALVKAGKMSKQDYIQWRHNQILTGNRWEEMLDTLTEDCVNADKIAMSIVNGHTPEAYAINANYGTYQIENGIRADTSFTLYDKSTVERMIKGQPDMLPRPRVDIPADKRWNKNHIRNEITQAVLQGESVPKIAKRLRNVTDMDNRAAVRNARTAITGAQNAGRVDSYKRAENMGIKVEQQWLSVHDGRTRHSHRQMDGIHVAVGEKFPNGCKFPGDPAGEPAEVYNCRCTLIPFFPSDTDQNWDFQPVGYSSYEEWKNEHAKKEKETGGVDVDKVTKNAKEFTSDYHETNNFSYDKWDGEFSEEERYGIKRYTGSSYRSMNGYLRGTKSDISDSTKEYIKNCESALSKCGIAEDTILYRGMGSERSLAQALGVDETNVASIINDGSIVGQRFIEKGFCSTGINSGAGWDKEVVLEIIAPKGTQGMYVDLISSVRGEQELLLQRGSIFEIVEAVDTGSGPYSDGRYRLKVVVIGNALS